jgi:hypothetical protein
VNYQSLVIVTNKGLTNNVFKYADDIGPYCGSVVTGRGSGSSGNKKMFPVQWEPEKEIVFLISPEADTEERIKKIADKVKLTAPGNGILFGFAIKRVHGFSKPT